MLSLICLKCQGHPTKCPLANLHFVAIPSICFRGPCLNLGHLLSLGYTIVQSYDCTTLIPKVSVQGVVALGGHFATFCQELDFNEAFFFHY